MGHDDGIRLYDEKLQAEVPAGGDIAYLLCGSGDARHLFLSLMGLSAAGHYGGQSQNKALSKVHITILDLNAASLAKTLVVFDTFMIYALLRTKKQPRIEDALTVMAYTYSAAFVPPFVVMKMLEHIRILIDDLESDGDTPGTTVLGFCYLPRDTRTQVLRKLKQWAEPLGPELSMAKIPPDIANIQRMTEMKAQSMMSHGSPKVSEYAKQ